jgi:nicotinate phosphoribosyltransferase
MKEYQHFSYLYQGRLALLTDLYQLTMANSYLKAGLADTEANFHLFFRRIPFKGGFALSAGLEMVINFVKTFHFPQEDLDYLSSLKGDDEKSLFDEDFLTYLSTFKLTCDIDAIPEGTVVFPHEPLIRVQGPLIEAQLLETPLLNFINFPTLIATKAARLRLAAGTDSLLEFGIRRAQGVDGGLSATRSAYIGGVDATSNVLAGKLFGIPLRGTHAHSWVQVFDEEIEAFRIFAENNPNNCTLLVDTYNTLQGVENAIRVGKNLKEKGIKLAGIRLDSGDFTYLSKKAREVLDREGFQDTQIVVSNELDEWVIAELKSQGANIDVWGVGTNLVTARDQPALDGVYKLSAVRHPGEDWKSRLKLSEQMIKVSNPGILQVRRYSKDGFSQADVIYDELICDTEEHHEIVDPLDSTRTKKLDGSFAYQDLLVPVFRKGKSVYDSPALDAIRKRSLEQLKTFHAGVKRFMNPHQYVVGMELKLYEKKIELIKSIRQ